MGQVHFVEFHFHVLPEMCSYILTHSIAFRITWFTKRVKIIWLLPLAISFLCALNHIAKSAF